MTANRAVQTASKAEEAQGGLVTLTPPVRPLVFISHDSRDAGLAESFANLLTDASGGTLKSFRSSDRRGTAGIEFGAEWYGAIMANLANATDVVGLLTANSIDRPWILYEVGVAKGRLDTVALGVALGVPLERASVGPFAQFQNCGDDEASLTALVLQLIRRNPEASPREEAVRRQVQAFRTALQAIPKTKVPHSPERVDETAIAKLFEEVKVLFRELPDQVERRMGKSRPREGRKHKRFTLRVVEELLFDPATDEFDPATRWLATAGILRDEIPWLQDVTLELYQALRGSRAEAINEAANRVVAILGLMGRALPMDPQDDDTFALISHLPGMIRHFADLSVRHVSRKRTNKAPPKQS